MNLGVRAHGLKSVTVVPISTSPGTKPSGVKISVDHGV